MRDLLIDPKTRDASDVSHQVVAVASSSSQDRATKFIADTGIPAGCAVYGDYESLVADKNVDVIYVATPHSHHYQNVMLALQAKKNVLCEKAFTVNAAQTKILCETAKKNNCFLMEAVWTRYFPLSIQVRRLIQSGEIGEVLRVVADTSFANEVEKEFDTANRMVNPDLAGGALLDCRFGCWDCVSWGYRSNGLNSGHLLPHLGFPNPLSHSSTRPAEGSHRRRTNDALPPHRSG